MIAIEDIGVYDRATRSEWAVRALLVGTMLLSAIGVGRLVAAAATDGRVRHIPAIHVDNRSHLALELTAVDSSGSRVELGARPPGASTLFEVVDMGPTWTFVASYGGREVFRQTVPRADVEARGWSLVIPASATADLERQGFR